MKQLYRLSVMAFVLILVPSLLGAEGASVQPVKNEPLFRPGMPWLDTDGQHIVMGAVSYMSTIPTIGLASYVARADNCRLSVFFHQRTFTIGRTRARR